MRLSGRSVVLWAAMGITSGGCTVAVTEAQMKDRTQAVQVAQQHVKTTQNNGAHAKRIAIIGLSTPNQVHDSSGDFHIGGRVGQVVDTIEAAKRFDEAGKAIACRALNASFDVYAKALTDDGFELVSPTEKLALEKFSLFQSGGPSDMCYASQAPARLNFLNPFKWKDTFRVIQDLIVELGVDGVIMGQVGANDMKTGEENISLYVKNPDGVARVGWSGRIKKGKFKFEPAIDAKTDEAKLANATRIFTHSFVLFSAKMAAEAK